MKKRILIIDDDEALLEGLELVLEEEGYEVKTLSMTNSLDQYVTSYRPNLILLDYRLPKNDGGEITYYFKHKENTKHIPIIMISASASSKKVAERVGADGFLEKPFDLCDLLGRMNTLVKKE